MEALFASGRIVDAILLLVAIEALILIPWRRGAGAALSLLCNLASGVALMLALRAALTGSHWTTVAGCLALAGLAHAGEMALRLGGPSLDRPARGAPTRIDPPA
ncbi:MULTISPECIES: hypothetical protein [Methylobacterium]|uniref:Uncharacterized protein n=1 Tax=Methylobacterium jeotgali TaxID=381630 RepID=A0ABQ4SP27_9HYPH|nr:MULTISPECIES: hypothetical protein [Methylobacterium]GBU17632.1 hypothetical protein AwMethylo_18470 [Methylobacterium sp.]GJE04976.1 hypothetical protein AOPFMNJM_0269 [Methylobacterium jeotgali]